MEITCISIADNQGLRVRIIKGLDNRGPDNRGSTVLHSVQVKRLVPHAFIAP